jgi:protocatechuate 3,4-dioxygenase beta subunit
MTHDLAARRALLRTAAGAGGLLLLGAGDLLAQDSSTGRTPPMAEGPFHPFGGGSGPGGDRRIRRWTDNDVDLTFVSDNPGTAQGYVAYVTGKVLDEAGRGVAGARVEVWQACASGRYNHRSDPSREWLDPFFQYSAVLTTDAAGSYRVRTIVPGAYRNDPTWVRPPHVHARVTANGYRRLTTQLFFQDVPYWFNRRWWTARDLESLNAQDFLFGALAPRDRALVLTRARRALASESATFARNSFVCPWDVTLVRTGATPAALATPELPD